MQRSWKKAMWRGFRSRCPSCGEGQLFAGYLATVDSCAHCGTKLDGHQAHDAPPYFTITIVGHIIVPLLLAVEKFWAPALWVHAVIWLPATLILTLWLLPRVKGAIVGMQWALRMHGFSAPKTENRAQT